MDEAIHLLCEAYLEPGDEVLIVTPTFSMYEIYAAATGATVVRVQCDDDFRFPLTKLLHSIKPATRMIAIASPNNPTGTVATREQLLHDCERRARLRPCWLTKPISNFTARPSSTISTAAGNLFVARTFSKAYGLAGLRIGVLAGPREQMPALRRVSSPYNVNAVALAALPVALEDREYIDCYVSQVRNGREQVGRALQALGVPYWPSHANFLLA